jgi:hypothetical protein
MKYLTGYEIGTLHSLMTEENLNLYINDFFNKYSKRVMSYYMRKIKENPISKLPLRIKQEADIIIWFNLYSLKPEVIRSKSDVHILKGALMDWEKHIEKLSTVNLEGG